MIGKQFTNLNRGVSPVVGVILMVAVTVILAAVIGSVVLDLGSGVSEPAQAGVSFDQASAGQIDTTDDGEDNPDTQTYEVDVQWRQAGNVDSLSVEGVDTDDTQVDTEDPDSADNGGSDLGDYDDPTTGSFSDVGDTVTVENLTAGDKVTVKGTVDGNQTVIQTFTVEG